MRNTFYRSRSQSVVDLSVAGGRAEKKNQRAKAKTIKSAL
jgi:hypothetical protein